MNERRFSWAWRERYLAAVERGRRGEFRRGQRDLAPENKTRTENSTALEADGRDGTQWSSFEAKQAEYHQVEAHKSTMDQVAESGRAQAGVTILQDASRAHVGHDRANKGVGEIARLQLRT